MVSVILAASLSAAVPVIASLLCFSASGVADTLTSSLKPTLSIKELSLIKLSVVLCAKPAFT